MKYPVIEKVENVSPACVNLMPLKGTISGDFRKDDLPAKLPKSFYQREDVVQVSRELLGKVLCTSINGTFTSGIITETEAYAGITDRASHACGGRRTKRTEVMYASGGVAYVYLCYGLHHLFNVVTAKADVPHAVLIRSIIPLEGKEEIARRRNRAHADHKTGAGPGACGQALGIRTLHSGTDLTEDLIWIEDRGIMIKSGNITATRRIGVDYAKEDALLPYRFVLKESPC